MVVPLPLVYFGNIFKPRIGGQRGQCGLLGREMRGRINMIRLSLRPSQRQPKISLKNGSLHDASL